MSLEVTGEETYDALKFDLGEPTEEMLEFARVHLGESPDTRACAVQNLSDMIYEKGEVTPHRMDDEYLVRFLRAKHFDVDKAHSLMIRYYDFKKKNRQYIEGVSPWDKTFQCIKEEGILSTPPYRDQLGRRILIVKVANWDTTKCSIEDILKANLMVLECAILEQRTQIYGGVVFFDMEGMSLKHTWQMTPTMANKIIQLMGISYPILILEVHILNQPLIYDLMFAMFKPLITPRMRELLHFHGNNYEGLHKFINPECLPQEYGGTRPPYDFTPWIDQLMKKPEIIHELESLGYSNVTSDHAGHSSTCN